MRKRTPLFIIVLALVVAVFFLICLFSEVGLALFNVLLGNEVYALTVKYQPSATYYRGEIVGMSFQWIFSLGKTKVPIETVLWGRWKVETLGTIDLGNTTFTLSLPLTIHILNRQTLFSYTFTFEDANSRRITIYLHRLQASHREITVEIAGYYSLNGTQAEINVGETLQIS